MPRFTPASILLPSLLLTSGLSYVQAQACQKYVDAAKDAANVLQENYFNGQDYGDQAVWISAVDALYLKALDQVAGTSDYEGVLGPLFDKDRNYLDTGKSYDDVQWVSITYGRSDDLENQKKYYDIASEGWDTGYCGGGVFWNGNQDYKNAITSELYITTSAYLHDKTNDEQYLNTAKDAWEWLKASDMRGENGLFNDGLTKDGSCANNGETQWTYNQAALLPGLAYLYKAGDESALQDAYTIIDAIQSNLLTNDALTEGCDPAGSCNDDQKSFKGITVFFISWFLEIAGTDDGTKYSDFVKSQADKVLENAGLGEGQGYTSVWYEKPGDGAERSDSSQGAALGALVGAASRGC